MNFFKVDNGKLIFKRRREILEISAWGDGLRVRASENRAFFDRPWALDTPMQRNAEIIIHERSATISNGKLTAIVTEYGKLSFFNQEGKLLLKEYYRSWEYGTEGWQDLDQISQIKRAARTYRAVGGDRYRIAVRFEANDEKFVGMGQYQQAFADLKGCVFELEQKNTQVSVPFLVSSLGYGFFWNNPAIGRASLTKSFTEWEAFSTPQIDYWVTAGDTPAEILSNYMSVVGRPPMMPDYAMGFWQCTLRYRT
ncbi:MAG: family 31 glucosidase, partial [Christensenellaceae bacterium]